MWQALSDPENGGSDVLSYNVQWDAGSGTLNQELIASSEEYLDIFYKVQSSVEGLTAGKPYKFRYRASNKYGPGEYSEISTHLAADIPMQADPVTTKIENFYVKIEWDYPDDKSSDIEQYEILIKQ